MDKRSKSFMNTYGANDFPSSSPTQDSFNPSSRNSPYLFTNHGFQVSQMKVKKRGALRGKIEQFYKSKYHTAEKETRPLMKLKQKTLDATDVIQDSPFKEGVQVRGLEKITFHKKR